MVCGGKGAELRNNKCALIKGELFDFHLQCGTNHTTTTYPYIIIFYHHTYITRIQLHTNTL